jgi:hypothetical protein
MEPFSVAASVITIATLANSVRSAVSDLQSLCRKFPGRLHALNNEVADLEIILRDIALLVEKRAVLPESNQSTIPHLLNRANGKLTELQDFVARLRSLYREKKVPIAAPKLLRKDLGTLQALQEDIRSVKCSLLLMLGASNSSVVPSRKLCRW